MRKTNKKPVVSPYETWDKLVVEDGATVALTAEVNGYPSGTTATVVKSIGDGAIIVIRIGDREFRVVARDLL